MAQERPVIYDDQVQTDVLKDKKIAVSAMALKAELRLECFLNPAQRLWLAFVKMALPGAWLKKTD